MKTKTFVQHNFECWFHILSSSTHLRLKKRQFYQCLPKTMVPLMSMTFALMVASSTISKVDAISSGSLGM